MKTKNLATKLYILVGILALAVGFAICFGISYAFINKETAPPQEPPGQEEPAATPSINSPSSIVMDKLETKAFEYSFTNIGEYTYSVEVENTSIATIQNNVITPNKVGSTNIIITINCSPVVSKTAPQLQVYKIIF